MWKKEAVIVKFVLLKPCRMNQSLAHFIYRHNPSFPLAGVPDHAAPCKTFPSPYSFIETACGHHLQIRSKTKAWQSYTICP